MPRDRCLSNRSKDSEFESGAFVCTQCAGVHRSLGVHVTFVLSCKLDNWSSDQVYMVEQTGGDFTNKFFEYFVPEEWPMPAVDEDRSYREAYLKQKYVERSFHKANNPDRARKESVPREGSGPMCKGKKDEVGMVEYAGVLNIHLIEATNLKGKCYVTFNVGAQSIKSKPAVGNGPLRLSWKELLMLCWNGIDVLEMRVYKESVWGDKLVGVHAIDIVPLIGQPDDPCQMWVPLIAPPEEEQKNTQESAVGKLARGQSDGILDGGARGKTTNLLPTVKAAKQESLDEAYPFQLVVTVMNGRNLGDGKQTINPYLSMVCGSQKMKTVVAKSARHPKWNQRFWFGSARPHGRAGVGAKVQDEVRGLMGTETLSVQVKSFFRFSPNVELGTVQIPLEGLEEGEHVQVFPIVSPGTEAPTPINLKNSSIPKKLPELVLSLNYQKKNSAAAKKTMSMRYASKTEIFYRASVVDAKHENPAGSTAFLFSPWKKNVAQLDSLGSLLVEFTYTPICH